MKVITFRTREYIGNVERNGKYKLLQLIIQAKKGGKKGRKENNVFAEESWKLVCMQYNGIL